MFAGAKSWGGRERFQASVFTVPRQVSPNPGLYAEVGECAFLLVRVFL